MPYADTYTRAAYVTDPRSPTHHSGRCPDRTLTELADRWLTERYIQHNPNAESGRAATVDFFTRVLNMKPRPIPGRLAHPVCAVIAENDYVIVVTLRKLPEPDDNTRSYTITWFDMWRFLDGKADEHWDGAMKGDIF